MSIVGWLKARNPYGRVAAEASRAGQSDVDRLHQQQGIGADWALPEYGDYYATTVPVYTAVNIRGNSMGLLDWRVFRKQRGGARAEMAEGDPLFDLLADPNPWFTPFELRRALEINISLWGRAFLSIEPSETGEGVDLWPLRPDRLLVVPGTGATGPYVQGYIYRGRTGKTVAYLPEEVEAFYNFNPLRDRTGMSPVAPVRLSVDMGKEGLSYNRETFRTGTVPDFLIMTEGTMTKEEADDFYRRWDERYAGPKGNRRPALLSNGRDVKALGFSNREMEFRSMLTWSLGDAGRVWGVPVTMMNDLEEATLANMELMERSFWRNTMQPQAKFYEQRWNKSLLPKLGFTGYEIEHDFSVVSVLGTPEEMRLRRESEHLDRGVMTINEVRRLRGQDDVTWGNEPGWTKPVAPELVGTRRPGERQGAGDSAGGMSNGRLSEELADLLSERDGSG